MKEEAVTTRVEADTPYEEELIGRAKARSPEAWTEIYNGHYAAIFRYAKARVFDEHTAEDLTSAVFLAALKGIDSYRYRGRPILAWLYRIARNVVASHQRQLLESRGAGGEGGLGLPRRLITRLTGRSRRREAEAGGTDASTATRGEGDPAMMVESLDLRDAIAALPAGQREVVILRFLVGLSAQEVAEVIDRSPAAVYSLQARAILALRERLR